MPFVADHLAFNCGKGDVIDRTVMLLRVLTQAPMQILRKVLDLEICHA